MLIIAQHYRRLINIHTGCVNEDPMRVNCCPLRCYGQKCNRKHSAITPFLSGALAESSQPKRNFSLCCEVN